MKHIYKDYLFGNTLIRYVISKESGKGFLNLFPKVTVKVPKRLFGNIVLLKRAGVKNDIW